MGAFGGIASGGSPVAVFTFPDTLTIVDNALIPWVPGRNQTVFGAFAQVKTAPVGDDIEILLKLINGATGATVSTLGTLVIPDGDLQSAPLTFTATAVPQNYSLAAEISQVGSGTAGANLTVEVYGTAGVDAAAPASEIIETSGPDILDVGAILDGQMVGRVGSSLVGVNPSAFQIVRAVDQSIPGGVPTLLVLDTQVSDTDSYWDPLDPTKITFLSTGFYQVNAYTQFRDAAAVGFYGDIKKNGVATGYELGAVASGTLGGNASVSVAVALTAGDVLTLELYQSDAGAHNMRGALSGFRIR